MRPTRHLCRSLITLIILVSAYGGAAAQTPPPVPQRYQAIYNEMSLAWSNYEAQIDTLWDGTKGQTGFSSEATYSNSNLGATLWTSQNALNAKTEIDRLAESGTTVAMFSVHFPYLYPQYYAANPSIPNDYPNYARFYKMISSYARSKGMKIAVETQDVFTNDQTVDLNAYYATLTWDDFKLGRMTTAKNIATIMQPDFIAIVEEPDTEVTLTGMSQMNTVSGIVELAQYTAQSLKAMNIPNMRIGAGSGTWFHGLYNLVPAICSIPEISYFNVHQYPTSGTVPGDFLQNLLYTVSAAHSYGKPIVLGEIWPYKESTSEYGGGITPFNVFRRNPYGFWYPIDIQAIRCLMKTAYWAKSPLMSTYFTQYHFSYLPYNTQTEGLSYEQITSLSMKYALSAMNAGTYSPTGTSYTGFINGTIPLR